MHKTIRNVALTSATLLLLGASAWAVKKDEPRKGPLDEVAEKYRLARAPKPGQPPTPAALSPGDCKSFAKDFIRAGEKERGREAEGLYSAGVAYDQCGMTRDAEDTYRRALAKNPRLAQAMNNLGVIYKNAGQAQAALTQFEAAIRVDPKSPLAVQAYNNKAALLVERAQQGGGLASYNEAKETLRRALAVDADSMAAYQLLAQIYYLTAETDRSKLRLAELVCDQAKQHNADYAPIYNTLGLIKLRRQDVTGALNEFRKAASLDPGLIEAQLNIAAISLSARSYKQAEDAFQAVLKKQPNNLDATIGMGVALRGQRRSDEAEKWYLKAGQLDPRNCAILYNLGVLYQDYKTGSPDEMRRAQDYYNKYVSCPAHDQDHMVDARRRNKDIDDTFKAMEEQKKLEAELKKQQEEMERQQKLMDEQMKKQGQAAPPATPK